MGAMGAGSARHHRDRLAVLLAAPGGAARSDDAGASPFRCAYERGGGGDGTGAPPTRSPGGLAPAGRRRIPRRGRGDLRICALRTGGSAWRRPGPPLGCRVLPNLRSGGASLHRSSRATDSDRITSFAPLALLGVGCRSRAAGQPGDGDACTQAVGLPLPGACEPLRPFGLWRDRAGRSPSRVGGHRPDNGGGSSIARGALFAAPGTPNACSCGGWRLLRRR